MSPTHTASHEMAAATAVSRLPNNDLEKELDHQSTIYTHKKSCSECMFYSIPTERNCNASRLEVPFLKGNRTEDASLAENVENVQTPLSIFCFEFELIRGQPRWFVFFYQRRAGRANWWRGGDSSVVRAPASDRKVAGSNPCRSGRRIFFFRVNFCADCYFGIRSTPELPQ